MKRRSKSVIISHAEKEIPAVVVLAHSSFFSFLFRSAKNVWYRTSAGLYVWIFGVVSCGRFERTCQICFRDIHLCSGVKEDNKRKKKKLEKKIGIPNCFSGLAFWLFSGCCNHYYTSAVHKNGFHLFFSFLSLHNFES